MPTKTIRAEVARFNGEMEAFRKNFVPDEVVGPFAKKIAFEVFQRIVRKTPVDTGRARGGWQVSVGSPVESDNTSPQKRAAGVLRREASTILSAPPFSVTWISNNVSYIVFLENGSSSKNRSGMVESALREVRVWAERNNDRRRVS